MRRLMYGLCGWVILSFAATGAPALADDSCTFANPDEARAMAERAASHLETVGPDQAFREFMDPEGAFIDRDLYVFVIDFQGILIASGAFPNSIGAVVADARDRNGRPFIQEMLELARIQETGWVEYDMVHPCTGEMTPKISFVKRVGPVIVGVGAFGTIGT